MVKNLKFNTTDLKNDLDKVKHEFITPRYIQDSNEIDIDMDIENKNNKNKHLTIYKADILDTKFTYDNSF